MTTNEDNDTNAESTKPLNDSSSTSSKMYTANVLTALTGAIELNILCHFPLLDPVAKATLKRTYLDDDIADVHKLTVAYETMAVVCHYKLLAHDVRQALVKQGDQLQEKRNQMSVKVPLRPQECLYEALKRDVAHFMSTCAQPAQLKRMIDSFEGQFEHRFVYGDRQANQKDAEQFLGESAELVKRTELWLNNVDKFEHHTVPQYRTHYRDFVEPLCCALAQLRHGFSGLMAALNGKREAVVKLDNGFYVDVNGPSVRLTAFLTNLIEFPANFELVARDIVPGYRVMRTTGDGEQQEQELVAAAAAKEQRERTNIYPLLERLPNGNALLFKYVVYKHCNWGMASTVTGQLGVGQN